MVFKVYVEPSQEQPQLENGDIEMIDQNLCSPDKTLLHVRVKNTDNLDEYKGSMHIETAFIDKLNRWIKKGKYQCNIFNHTSEMELKVEMFKTQLKKQAKDEIQQLKQELCMMRKENQRVKGEQKLFRHYFLNMWKDKCRQYLFDKPELKLELIESCQNLYDQYEAIGVIMEEFGSKGYYLNFKFSGNALDQAQQMFNQNQLLTNSSTTAGGPPSGPVYGSTLGGPSTLINSGTTMGGPTQISTGTGQGFQSSNRGGRDLISSLCELGEQMNGNRYIEVFILGGAYQYQKAVLDVQKLFNNDSGEVFSLVQISIPIEDTSPYTVFIPKRLQN
eukprot:403348586